MQKVLVVGVGVLGLPVARQLGQAGYSLGLCDPDRVEERNCRCQQFDRAQIGMHKVAACAELIRRNAPDASLALVADDVRTLGVGYVLDVDLVVAAVDNRAAEIHCARLALLAGKPYLRVATIGQARVVDVTLVPAPRSARDPCGVCSFTPADYELAELRESCASEVEVNPAAGAATFVQHGALAAGLAVDAIIHNELDPARRLRFAGGSAPQITTTTLPGPEGCSLFRPPWPHGPDDWQHFPNAEQTSMGQLLDAAYAALGAPADAVAVEPDVPLCLFRTCPHCHQKQPPAFRSYSAAGVQCPRCGKPILQESLPPSPQSIAVELEPLRSRTVSELAAPAGLGLRFASPDGRLFSACIGPATDAG
jgi:hypothetical protein